MPAPTTTWTHDCQRAGHTTLPAGDCCPYCGLSEHQNGDDIIQRVADMPTFTAAQKLQEIELEIKARRRLYSQKIEKKSMKRSTAQKKLALLTAIANDYREQCKPQPDLI